MSATGSEEAGGALSPRRLLARVRALLADGSHHSIAQRVAGTAFLIRVASAAIAYVSQVLMARWMGGAEFGIYISVWVTVLLVGHLANAGLASATQRFVPEYAERRDMDGLRGFIAGSSAIGFASGTAFALLGLGVLWLFGRHLAGPALTPLVLAALCLPVYVLTDIQDGIARSQNWTDLALGPPYLLRPIVLLAVMIGAHEAGIAATAVTAMASAVVATWCAAAVQFALLHRRLKHKVPAGPRRLEAGFWLRTSVPIFLVEAFYMALTYADVLLLKQFRPAEEVAVYWAAVKTLALVAFIYFSVAAAAAHRFSEYHVAGDRERLSDFLQASIRWTFFPSLAATLVILALGKPFLMLFGPDFVAGYPAMFVISAGMLARAAVGPVERLLSMSGHQGICAAIYGLAFGLAVGLCLVLIPPFGMMGAAAASAIALTVESVLLFVITRRRLGLTISLRRPARAS